MTAKEIIQRSIEAHPADFRAALVRQAETHDDAARTIRDHRAWQGAIASRGACLEAYDAIPDSRCHAQFATADEAAAYIAAKCGRMVIALNVACKLQGLSAADRTAAAVDWQESQQ